MKGGRSFQQIPQCDYIINIRFKKNCCDGFIFTASLNSKKIKMQNPILMKLIIIFIISNERIIICT